MKIFTHNIIKKGILAILVLFVFLVPISVSITTSDVFGGVIAMPQFAMTMNTAAAWSLVDFGKASVDIFLNVVGQAIMGFAAMITWAGGGLLDIAISQFVLGMGSQINGKGLGTAIDETWRLIRDISNLAFIFGFIYTGIRTILDPESASTKRFLSKIIIGALLINFSLFFVKAVIDFANFTAVQIYNTMIAGEGSLSATITNKLGLISFYDIKTGNITEKLLAEETAFMFYIMASIFLVVSGFVFAASAIMIVVRFITLIFIMIFSPILFAATVFPQTEKYASDLWAKLMSSAFYVPVYLLLTFISIKLIESANLSAPGTTFSAALVSPTPGSFGIILQFVVIIFFMMQSLLIANKFSIAGADAITTKTRTLIGASTAGLAARAGRASVGRFGNWASEKEGLKDAASKSGPQGYLARMALKSTRGAADASFDARNTSAGKALKVGEGRKGGWKTVQKETNEKEEKFARSLGEVKDTDILVEARKKEHDDEKTELSKLQDAKSAATTAAAKQAISVQITAQEKKVEDAKLKYESEKQRRIIGSTYAKPRASDAGTLTAYKVDIKTKKDALKAEWEGYVMLSEADKETARPGIQARKDALKKVEDDYKKLMSTQEDRGYAGVLEKSSRMTAWPAGRMVSHEKEAGDSMRKTAEKGLPKVKE